MVGDGSFAITTSNTDILFLVFFKNDPLKLGHKWKDLRAKFDNIFPMVPLTIDNT